MRLIAPNEVCLSATAIAEKFESETGFSVHPTNVGVAAKKLNLDYIEVEVDAPPGCPIATFKQKRYSVEDIPAIFNELRALVDARSKYARR